MDIVIDNRLRFKKKDIPTEMWNELKETFTYTNPDYINAKRMGFYTKGIPQTIETYQINMGEMSLPRGASKKLKKIAAKYGILTVFIDKRISVPVMMTSSIQLREYQKAPCNNMVVLQNTTIQGVCGSGKTVMLLKAIELLRQKTLVVVHEQKLQKQWVDSIVNFFGIPIEEIGLIGGIAKGKDRIGKHITVGLQQSLKNKGDKYAKEFGCIVGDEVHRFAANTFQQVIDVYHAKYRLGATATPHRKDGKHFLVFDMFGEISAKITDEMLLELDETMDVKIVVIPTQFEFDEKQKRSKRVFIGNNEDGDAVYDKEEIESINRTDLVSAMILDKDRNKLIYRFIEAEVKNGRYCILLADRRRFCLNWQKWLGNKGIEAKLLIGGDEHREEGEEAINRIMHRGDLHVVIGTTVADEGLDIKRLDRGFSATPTATNERRIVQQVGRIKRKMEGKKDAIWYYFLDRKVEGFQKHLKLLQKYFRTVEYLEDENGIEEYLHILSSGKS